MLRTLRLFMLAALAAASVPGTGVGGETFDAATRSALQMVITKQLDAFAHEDAKAAEAFASPAIQSRFPEPAQFFEMVKKNYAVLVRPKSTQFGETAPSPHGPLQTMTVVAADGTVWKAVYAFEQIAGAWRITGCGVAKDDSQQAI